MSLIAILMLFAVTVLFFPCAWLSAGNSSQTMDAIEELQEQVERAPTDTLFIFDVDHVLTMPCDPCFQILTPVRHKALVKPIFASLSEEELNLMYTLTVMQCEQILVEPTTLSVLQAIKAKGHRMMALTALHVAELNGRETTEWRLGELRRLGIELDTAFPGVEPFAIKTLAPHLGGHPTYREGVLFSNTKHDKGTVLKAFLEKVAYKPSAIVFVDDVLENITAVTATAAELGIPCSTVHYRGAYMAATPAVDGQFALVQWQALAEQARRLIAKMC